ncbi:frataxin-like protein [Sarcoptes scabiei]|nr:frataxin-like protein [Sarcoptes scabiei]
MSENSIPIDEKTYEKIADETLDRLNDRLEHFIDSFDNAEQNCDISFNNGVLTLSLGEKGVYVINRQTPNRQIWLSSPMSGPKRYDYIDGQWIYKHDGQSLNDLLRKELSKLFDSDVDL